MPDQSRQGLGAAGPELSGSQQPGGAYTARFVRRDVKLTAYTDTEIQTVSFANTKITAYLSWASFWFGVLVNGILLPTCPPLSRSTVLHAPYLWAFVGLFGLLAAGFEFLQRRSLYDQIQKETTTPAEP